MSPQLLRLHQALSPEPCAQALKIQLCGLGALVFADNCGLVARLVLNAQLPGPELRNQLVGPRPYSGAEGQPSFKAAECTDMMLKTRLP